MDNQHKNSPNDHDTGQDTISSNNNNNNKKAPKEKELYVRGSGPLKKMAESDMNDNVKTVYTDKDNLDKKNNNPKKPDSQLYVPKGAQSQDQYHSGGRDSYSNSGSHRNYSNNNRNRHGRSHNQRSYEPQQRQGNTETSNKLAPSVNQGTKSFDNKSGDTMDPKNENNVSSSGGAQPSDGKDAPPARVPDSDRFSGDNRQHQSNRNFKNNRNNSMRNSQGRYMDHRSGGNSDDYRYQQRHNRDRYSSNESLRNSNRSLRNQYHNDDRYRSDRGYNNSYHQHHNRKSHHNNMHNSYEKQPPQPSQDKSQEVANTSATIDQVAQDMETKLTLTSPNDNNTSSANANDSSDSSSTASCFTTNDDFDVDWRAEDWSAVATWDIKTSSVTDNKDDNPDNQLVKDDDNSPVVEDQTKDNARPDLTKPPPLPASLNKGPPSRDWSSSKNSFDDRDWKRGGDRMYPPNNRQGYRASSGPPQYADKRKQFAPPAQSNRGGRGGDLVSYEVPPRMRKKLEEKQKYVAPPQSIPQSSYDDKQWGRDDRRQNSYSQDKRFNSLPLPNKNKPYNNQPDSYQDPRSKRFSTYEIKESAEEAVVSKHGDGPKHSAWNEAAEFKAPPPPLDYQGHHGPPRREALEGRDFARNTRRRRKSGSSQGSRRRSGSRDTIDTNISSASRSRKNSDRSTTSGNWRDRPSSRQDYSNIDSNWRESQKRNTSPDSSNWRARPNLPEVPSKQQTSESSAQKYSKGHSGGIIRIPVQPNKEDNNKVLNQPYPTKELYNPSSPHNPIPVRPNQVRLPLSSSTLRHHPIPVDQRLAGDRMLAHPENENSMLPNLWFSELPVSDSTKKEIALIIHAEREIMRLIKGNTWPHEIHKLKAARDKIKECLINLIRYDIKFCEQENAENVLWKVGFYQIIETIRNNPLPYNKNFVIEIIEDAVLYFISVLTCIEDRYKIKLDDFLLQDNIQNANKMIPLALNSAQKICIFLGDLSRYKETFNNSNDFTIAKDYYNKAIHLNPRHFRPYHQLGVVAVIERKQLEAVYYYSRSLMAPMMQPCAKERLQMIFDENRKKYDADFSHFTESLGEDQKAKEVREYRREIWIRPDVDKSTQWNQLINESEHELELQVMEKLKKLNHVELMKKFICSFLLVHGKLFLKTNLEEFQNISKQMLREFKLLLMQDGFNHLKLLQIITINMFSIMNLRMNETYGDNYKSLYQELAIIIFLEMFYCMLHQFNRVLSGLADFNIHTLLSSKQLTSLLTCIKVMCDWFACQMTTWNPPPSCSDYHLGENDCWSELAVFINNLQHIKCDPNLLMSFSDVQGHPVENLILIKLPEDSVFVGCTPFNSSVQDSYYVLEHLFTSTHVDIIYNSLRIKLLLFFGTVFLVGVDPPVLKLHKTETGLDVYISIVESVNKDDPIDKAIAFDCNNDFDEQVTKHQKQLDTSNMSAEYRELLVKREILNEQNKQYERNMNIVQQDQKINRQLMIKPNYIIPDTNCFIDYLPLICVIINKQFNHSDLKIKKFVYTLLIPIIVFEELKNISKNNKKCKNVVQNAQAALGYIQSNGNINIKFVTTKGTIISKHNNGFSEDGDGEVKKNLVLKNDDRILETCNNLSIKIKKEKQEEDKKEGDVTVIQRSIVLLTEDRNLRLKSLASDIPVTSIGNFAQWAGLS